MEKKTILAISDFGTSGIAESMRHPLTHWHNKGHEIWHLALGYHGWPILDDQRKMYPWADRMMPILATNNDDKFGQKQILRAITSCNPHYVITAFDAWMISYLSNPETNTTLDEATRKLLSHDERTFQHIAYFPMDAAVDSMFLPSGMEEMVAGFDIPVTYSRFSKKVLERDTGIQVPFIPIAHDPKIFYPGDRIEARAKIGFEAFKGKFIVAMIGTNQYRKAWKEFFDAVGPFARAHRDDVLVMPFTTWNQKIMGGAEIHDLIWRNDIAEQIIDPREFVGKMTEESMGHLYRALDVVVLTTAGEGAGLPPLRARACGTPALVSNNTSNTEFCADDFERIPCIGTYADPFGSNLERHITDTAELTLRLEKLYTDRDFQKELGLKGVAEMKKYEINNVTPSWDALLENYP